MNTKSCEVGSLHHTHADSDMCASCGGFLTEVGAELRKGIRHELPGLMRADDVGDVLATLL